MKIEKIDVIKVIDDIIAKSINIDSITILEKAKAKIRQIDTYPIDIGKLYNYTKTLTGLRERSDIYHYIIETLIKDGSIDKDDYLSIGKIYQQLHDYLDIPSIP